MNDKLNRNQRYQDLSREQAFALEARILLRMFPLLVPKQNSNPREIHDYFVTLTELAYLLCDVGLGNKTLLDAKLQGKKFHDDLQKTSRLVSEKSVPAAEAVLCVIDALGELDLIRFFVSGISEQDRKNLDVGALVSAGSFSLSKMGMTEDTFLYPTSNDCNFIFSHAQDTYPFVNPIFFARELWPLPGPTYKDKGMVPAFEMVILEDWKDSLHELGLSGIVANYDNLLHGMNLVQINNINKKQETTVVTNINISGGNFIGSQVGSSNSTLNAYMEALKIGSYSSKEEHELKQALANLREGIESDPSLKQPQRQAAAVDLANFSEEIKKPLEEQDAETKKIFWNRLTEVTKFSAALVTLTAAVAKLTGLA